MTAALAVLAAASTLVACGGGEAAGACSHAERTRAQFPAGHLLPGQPEPTYLSEPPTSGPHAVVVTVPTQVTEPLSRPLQVGLLELGLVLVQYRPADVGPEEVARLEALAGATLLVAPNADLPDPVVASAWLSLQRCQDVDTDAIARFAEDRASRAPGGHLDG